MKAAKFYTRLFSKPLCVLLLVLPVVAYGEDDEPWIPHTYQEPEPWREQQVELPAFPQQRHYLDTGVNTAGLPYRIYLDPNSLVRGDDSVMRYTVVIVSSSGVENVTHEGLHCGANEYRRYAYGVSGVWHKLGDTPWLPIAGRGINRYRRVFYRDYMCDPVNPVTNVNQILERFRSNWNASTD